MGLIAKLSMRNQIQSAISDLIRCYEMTTGQAVIRVEIGNDNRNVILDAVPSPPKPQWIT